MWTKLLLIVANILATRSLLQRPIHATYYKPGVPTLHLGDNGESEATVNWSASTTVPYWPHYNTRTVQVLDGVWYFGVGGNDWDLNKTIDPSKFVSLTPNTTYVPSAYDVKLPGVEGYIGTGIFSFSNIQYIHIM